MDSLESLSKLEEHLRPTGNNKQVASRAEFRVELNRYRRIIAAFCFLVLFAFLACSKTKPAAPEVVLTIIDQSWIDKPSQALLGEELQQFTQATGIRFKSCPHRRWC